MTSRLIGFHPSFRIGHSAFVGLSVVGLLSLLAGSAAASIVIGPAGFTAPMTIINYSTSPGGAIPGGTSITTQYAAIGVGHDGSTTTSGAGDGPPGMSSLSGLPALESPVGDPDPNVPITVTFTVPVSQLGAFFIMAFELDSITLTARRADSSIIESHTILPASMTLGPFGLNEGFLGAILSEPAASATFSIAGPVGETAFAIDDLHFGFQTTAAVPEPATLAVWSLLTAAGACLIRRAKR